MNSEFTQIRAREEVVDALARPMRSLRVSVTDRCNLRCQYCMPEAEYVWLAHQEILTFEEIGRLVSVFTGLGVDKVRLTGGEPLLRHNLERLVEILASNDAIRDLALTTNGVLLARHARTLRQAGLRRVTVSLDTLRQDRFRTLARGAALARVVEGIEAARQAGFEKIKINSVIVRGVNEDELAGLVEFGRKQDAEIRFVEYMDVGGATRWGMDRVVPQAEMLQQLEAAFGKIEPLPHHGSAPAARFLLPDGTKFGIIASTTQPFCRACDRGRITTDGLWFLCLYARQGTDLKRMLRGGSSNQEIAGRIRATWMARDDRGAEERHALIHRDILFPVEDLKADPHREMHTRGG
ncbi:MAG TPA: GTP 3',8-cyclase MoaA [Terriglobia bacterium]|nr:GTP 3',8-cyclase MoaA [Terriglobia bacterium]